MTNQEMIDELQLAIDLIKQDGKDWLDERDIPFLEKALSILKQGTHSDLIEGVNTYENNNKNTYRNDSL